MQRYVRFCEGLDDKGTLLRPEEVNDYIVSAHDCYVSIFYYNEEHLKRFQQKGTIKGITDVVTDKLVFDFDSKDNIEVARTDSMETIARLEKYGIAEKNVEIYFSGNKGFTLVVNLPKDITPDEAANIAIQKIGYGLVTLDKSIYNASRILRLPGTKHQVSGMYKIPLTREELSTWTIEEIWTSAEEPYESPIAPTSSPIKDLFVFPKKENKPKVSYELELTKKPYKWSNCKWSLLQGNFKSGERDQAMMVIAATCRGLGYDRETTYYICKSALKKSWAKFGEGDFGKEELWKNVIENQIFADGWNGGQYSCSTNTWLHSYCEELGDHKCKDRSKEDAAPSVSLNDVTKRFFNYAKDFEKNKIKTGIPELDRNINLCTSTLCGLLGQPGAGKTSAALQYIKNTSKDGVNSMMFSMDMGEPIVYAKMIQNQTGRNFDNVMKLFKETPEEANKIADVTNEVFKNAAMNFKSGLTVADIKEAIQAQNEKNGPGNEVKLVVIDYLECIAGPYSDATANTGFIANQLKDVANELQICILLLLQTQKHSTPDVSDPLLTLKGVKGSSLIEQSCSVILTLWREGYGPNYVEDDRYISFATVKNRFGSLWRDDFSWDGVKGNISSLTSEQRQMFAEFRQKKEMMKKAEAEEKKKITGEWQ